MKKIVLSCETVENYLYIIIQYCLPNFHFQVTISSFSGERKKKATRRKSTQTAQLSLPSPAADLALCIYFMNFLLIPGINSSKYYQNEDGGFLIWLSFTITQPYLGAPPTSSPKHHIHFKLLQITNWAPPSHPRPWRLQVVFSKNYVLVLAYSSHCIYLGKCE